MREHLKFVAYQDGDVWVAACLEHDICAHGNTLFSAVERLGVTLKVEDHVAKELGRKGFRDIPAAPPGTYDI